MGAHKGRCANATDDHRVCNVEMCKRGGRPWHLHGDCMAFLEMSLGLQHCVNAVKARLMRCERRGHAVKAP